MYVADAKGLWKEEGLEVDVTYFDSGRKALDALLANNAEVMSVSETPPLRAFLSGSEIKIVATVGEHREAKMTVRTEKIRRAENLKGKRIGTVSGTNSDYYMYRWLEQNNISQNEVEIIQLDAAALSQAFVQGDIDAMFAWEPYNYNAASKLPNLAESWSTEIYSGRHTVVMNNDYASQKPEVAESLIKGFIRAQEYIKNNPEEAKRILMDRTKISEDTLNGLWEEYIYKVQLDDGFLDIIQDQASWITTSQDLKPNKDAARLIDPSYMLAVDDKRVGGAFKN